MGDTEEEEAPRLKPSDIKSRFEQKASESGGPVKRNFGGEITFPFLLSTSCQGDGS